MRINKFFKMLLIIIIIPIVVFVLLGLFQGLYQISYHFRIENAIESYRIAPPMCFVFFTPPTGHEKVTKILDTYNIDEKTIIVVAQSELSDDKNEDVVCICQVKNFFGKKIYKSTGVDILMTTYKDCLSYNSKTYKFYKTSKSKVDKTDESIVHSFPSVDKNKEILMRIDT